MSKELNIGDVVEVKEWGRGVVVGSSPYQITDATPSGKVWIVTIDESGKQTIACESDLKLLTQ